MATVDASSTKAVTEHIVNTLFHIGHSVFCYLLIRVFEKLCCEFYFV